MMGTFGRRWRAPKAASPSAQPPTGYIDREAVSEDVRNYPRDLVGSIEQMLEMAARAGTVIPGFSASARAGRVELERISLNTDASQPWFDKVQVIAEPDVYCFWYRPSGGIWKAECRFRPDGAPGFVLKARQAGSAKSGGLEIAELSVEDGVDRGSSSSL